MAEIGEPTRTEPLQVPAPAPKRQPVEEPTKAPEPEKVPS